MIATEILADLKEQIGTAPDLSEAAKLVRAAMGVVAEHLDYRASKSMVQESIDLGSGIDAMKSLNDALRSICQFSE